MADESEFNWTRIGKNAEARPRRRVNFAMIGTVVLLTVIVVGGIGYFVTNSTGEQIRTVATALGMIVAGVVVAVLYALPSGIAIARNHQQVGPIMIVNILLGFTYVGWVVALAMSVSEVKRR